MTTLTFNPGETSKPITVAVKGDTLDENDETFFVQLSNPNGAMLADAQGLGTILDDDTAGTLQFDKTAFSVAKDGGSITITVDRTGRGRQRRNRGLCHQRRHGPCGDRLHGHRRDAHF